MWVLTRTSWPTLVNLAVVSQVGYKQVAKYSPQTRVVASTWEQELDLAECATGEAAQRIVRLLAHRLAEGREFVDLSAVDDPAPLP